MTVRRRTRPSARTALTAEQAALADQQRQAAAGRAAAITVTDSIISSGCSGPGCTSDHEEHVRMAKRMPRTLGLMPDPMTEWRPGPGYSNGNTPHRRTGGAE
jgi:hypothetical protein